MADENFGTLSVDIVGDYSKLQDDFAQAAGIAEDAGASIAGSFNNAAAEFDRTGEAATAAAESISGIGPATHEAAVEAHEAGSGFGEFLGVLGEFAGVLGIATGLEEIGREALTSAARVERFVGSMTALTGNAELAEESVTKLKDLALEDALSFPTLLVATQRMTAMGFESAQIDETLRSVADASRALGRDFETVSSSVERLALSGNAGARQLVQLGLSLGDLAAAMGVSEAKAKDMFKALDESARMDVLNAAMQKFAGTAQATAKDMTGSWQNFKTQLELTAEEMGKIAGPVATFMLGGLQQIAEWLNKFIQFMGGGLNQIAEWIESAARFVGVTHIASDSTKNWSDQLSESARQIEINVERNQRIKDALSNTKDALSKATDAAAAHTDKLLEAVKAYDRTRGSVGELNSAWMRALEIAIQSKDRLGEQVDAFRKVAAAVDAMATAHEAWGTKLTTIHRQIANELNPDVNEAANGMLAMKAAQDLVTAATSAQTAGGYDYEAMLRATKGTLADLQAAMKAITEEQNAVTDGSDLEAAAMRQVGLTSASVTDGILADLRNVFDELIRLRDEYGDAAGVIGRDLETVGDEITKLSHKHDDLKDKMHTVQTEGQKMCTEINRALERDLSRALSDVIFQTGKIGDAFVKLGKDIVSIILDHIIARGLKPLLDELDKVLTKVPGLSGIGGGATTSAGGAAGGIGGAAGGIVGTVAGIAGAVGSIGTAILTGIFDASMDSKLFHIQTSLLEIRNNLEGTDGITAMTKLAAQTLTDIDKWIVGPVFEVLVGISSDLDDIAETLKRLGSPSFAAPSSGPVAALSFIPSMAGGGIVVNGGINVHGVQSAEQFARQLPAYLKSVSPKFTV